MQAGRSPLNIDRTRSSRYEIPQTNKSQYHARFHSNSLITFRRKMAQKFSFSCILLTLLNQCQGQKDEYQSSIYHHSKFEPNQFLNVPMHATLKVFGAVCKTVISHQKWSQDVRFNCFITIPNFIPFRCIKLKKIKPRGFTFCQPYDSHPQSRSLKVVQNGRSHGAYMHER